MKADLYTYFIYTVFMAAMITIPVSLTKYELAIEKIKKYKIAGVFFILTYILFVGLRNHHVGTDYDVYLGWFKTLQSTGKFPVENSDIGYVWLNKFLVYFDAPYPTLFVIISFVQIFFLYKSLKRMPFLAPYYFFFFFTTLFFATSMNHMRQTMAYQIFFYSILLFFERRFLLMIVLVVVAASLHKSVLMYAWVYPLLHFDWYKNRVVQIVILVICALASNIIFTFLFSNFAVYANLLNYGYYVENIDMISEISEGFATGAGLGKYLFLLMDALIVFYSPELKERFKDFHFTAFYNLYFTGAFLENVFASNYIFARTVDYMSYFRILILSFLLLYLAKKENEIVRNYAIMALIIVLQLAYYYRGIYSSAANCSPYAFIF